MKKICFLFILINIFGGCKKINHYTGNYNFTIGQSVSSDPFGPPIITGLNSPSYTVINTTGSIKRKNKLSSTLVIAIDHYREPFEIKVNDKKEFSIKYPSSYSYVYLAGKWTDENNIKMTYSIFPIGGGGRSTIDNISGVKSND